MRLPTARIGVKGLIPVSILQYVGFVTLTYRVLPQISLCEEGLNVFSE